jgi:hypothetical protein
VLVGRFLGKVGAPGSDLAFGFLYSEGAGWEKFASAAAQSGV